MDEGEKTNKQRVETSPAKRSASFHHVSYLNDRGAFDDGNQIVQQHVSEEVVIQVQNLKRPIPPQSLGQPFRHLPKIHSERERE
jgi:hypothetical protein